MNKDKNLMEAALGLESSGAIFMANGEKYDKEAIHALNDMKEVAKQTILRKNDEELQVKVDKYNKELNKKDSRFDNITIPNNMVIVKLARLPHIDPNTGFVISRILHEPSQSGADVKGKPVENTYPYYDFGYVVASDSSWVTKGNYVQLAYDAIMQQFQREEGKWRYTMPNEFTFWNDRASERSIKTMDCFVLIRDYQVECVFPKDYKPVYE